MTERDINKLLEDYNFYKEYAEESKKLLSYYGDRINSYRKTLRRQNKGIRRLRKKLNYYKEQLQSCQRTYYWKEKNLLERIEMLEKSGDGKRIKELEKLVAEYNTNLLKMFTEKGEYKRIAEEKAKENKILTVRNIELCKTKNTMEKEIKRLLERNAILAKQLKLYERNETSEV